MQDHISISAKRLDADENTVRNVTELWNISRDVQKRIEITTYVERGISRERAGNKYKKKERMNFNSKENYRLKAKITFQTVSIMSPDTKHLQHIGAVQTTPTTRKTTKINKNLDVYVFFMMFLRLGLLAHCL